MRSLDEVWDEDALIDEIDRLETLIAAHLHASQQDTTRAIDDMRSFIKSRRNECNS